MASAPRPEFPTVAVFDFDGTFTRRDSTIAFCRAVVPAARLWPAILRQVPIMGRLVLGRAHRAELKEALLTAFFAGVHERDIRARAVAWALHDLFRLVRRGALERLAWHRAQGHRTVLVSASLELYLAPWARSVGIDDVLATRLEARDGRLTGRFRGRNCYGQEKVERLRELLGDLDSVELYAYGDSRGDRELLAAADHAFYRPFR